MDTVVEIQVVVKESIRQDEAEAKVNKAFEAFRHVEDACSRFNPESELMKACSIIEEPVKISPYLFEPLRFALEMAKFTEGEFDPTIGKMMELQGYNRHYLTGKYLHSPSAETVSYQDIVLNEQDHTLFLKKPLVLDLGAVAKGFAIDLSANELKCFDGFIVNAGGDLFVGGLDQNRNPWKVGIQHPKEKDQIIHMVEVTNEAICTSGSYERMNVNVPGMHHIINPKTKHSPNDWVSCSVIAPFAMMADSFSTTAFLLGNEKGKRLIEDNELRALFITPDLQKVSVGGNI